jgi:hypothetical protein
VDFVGTLCSLALHFSIVALCGSLPYVLEVTKAFVSNFKKGFVALCHFVACRVAHIHNLDSKIIKKALKHLQTGIPSGYRTALPNIENGFALGKMHIVDLTKQNLDKLGHSVRFNLQAAIFQQFDRILFNHTIYHSVRV